MPKFLHEFLRYADGTVIENGWWEIKGDRLINMVGGWHPYNPREDDIIIEAENIESLDWSCLIDNKYSTGWLDLDGNFYGCEPTGHSMMAEFYFKSSERELEKIGFVKLFRDYDQTINWYCEKREPTKKQEDYLLENGLF